MMLNNSGPALAIAAGACTLLWCPGYYSCCWREKLLLSLVWSLMYIVVIVISVIVILSHYCCFDYCNYIINILQILVCWVSGRRGL